LRVIETTPETARPAAFRSIRVAVLGVMCLTLLVACSGGPAATAFVAQADLIRFDDVEVRLVDTLGLTEALLPVPDSLGGPFVQGIQPVPGHPRDLIVPWSGGDCDVQTTLTLHLEGGVHVISVRSISRPHPGGVLCTLAARLSAVVVRFLGQPPVLLLDLGP
jgi:hypothetical protein